MDNLKRELLQAHKTRDGLMKWKLLVVAAVGSVALGVAKGPLGDHASLALCVIPFACCYIDLLCRNLSIRTKLVSKFISEEFGDDRSSIDGAFERFYQLFDEKRGRDALEGFALVISTVALSILVPLVGLVAHPSATPLGWQRLGEWPSLLFLGAGVGGLLGSALVQLQYCRQRDAITATGAAWKEQRPGQSRPTPS